MTRTGRRPGDSSVTKSEILDAARSTFAELGYESATLRRIATAAGVDVALISHYFGSKENLFVAVHDLPITPSEFADVFEGASEDEIGRRVARRSLSALAADDSPAISLMRAASTNANAAAMLREFIDGTLIDPISQMIDAPDARERVALVASQLLGVLFTRHVVGVHELNAAAIDDLVEAIAPTLQRYLSGPAWAAERVQHPAAHSAG
ncbi:MAG: TetR family transcriptional regulator [Actinomycetota bacterium]|nr:TetR family transcriptional regulator [Actinomycetota bacterium]